MPRVVRLPPLIIENGMMNNGIRHSTNRSSNVTHRRRRSSILSSSDPQTDISPIDYILVYNDEEKDHNQKGFFRPSERRKRFEDYLIKKQYLHLQHSKSHAEKIGYVRVHSPFTVLLSTAEKIRMRLPIEKIEEDEVNINTPRAKSCWYRFKLWFKKPFRLDPSLTKDDPDYYTAVYSSNIGKFEDMFDTLRGSRDLYFTASERSLLTYELLSRAHFDDDDDDDDNKSERPVQKLALTTDMGLRKGSRRPGIQRLIAKKAYDCYYPLHESLRDDVRKIPDENLNDREKLQKHWATMRLCLKFQPLSLIRSYMGEKVAFYFAHFGYYNQMLIPAALVGLIIFIYGAASVATDQSTSDICGDLGQSTYMCPICDKVCSFYKLSDSCVYSKLSYVSDNAATIVFGVLMSLWARLYVEFWKRRQAVLQYEWDSMDFEEHLEPIRPEFESQAKKHIEKRVNAVTGIEEPYVSTKKRIPYFLIATAVVLLAMAIVCATLFATIVYRVQMTYILKKTSVTAYSSVIITVTSAIMNLICTLLLSLLYYWLARKLTDHELHKYQSTYDDSFIIKIYLFEFVNFYSSLFYIAFFKGRFFEYPSKYGTAGSGDFTEQCDPAGCFVELSIQLIIFMIGNQLINNLLEFLSSMTNTCRRKCCSRTKDDRLQQWEIDRGLISFESDTLIKEYLELVIQFGFVTLFVVAFPLAPLFALLNNLIEIRLDAWKLLSKYRRPIPFKASDIGIWSSILSAVSYLAVLTNAAIMAFTSEFIPKMTYRVLVSGGTSLNGYVNWTLSAFPIADYNATGLMPSDSLGLTYCRYRDFRSTTSPYSHTSVYWNVLAGRLAFIIVFEHLIFFIIYIIQWLVPDVPKKIRDKIDHERYIDQYERWKSHTDKDHLQEAAVVSEAIAKMNRVANENTQSSIRPSKTKPTTRRGTIRVKISPTDKR